MAVAKPRDDLTPKSILGRVYKEKTGKELGQIKRDILSEVAMNLIPGGGFVAKPVTMLKSHALGKTAITGLRQGMGRKVWPWLKEMWKVPRREYARIKDISVKPPRGNVYGSFDTATGKIELYKTRFPQRSTPTHELAHGRHSIPELAEKGPVGEMMRLATELEKRGIEPLVKKLPWEMHAESVAAEVAGKGSRLSQREYDVVFRRHLGKAAKRARAIKKDLPGQEEEYITELLGSVGL